MTDHGTAPLAGVSDDDLEAECQRRGWRVTRPGERRAKSHPFDAACRFMWVWHRSDIHTREHLMTVRDRAVLWKGSREAAEIWLAATSLPGDLRGRTPLVAVADGDYRQVLDAIEDLQFTGGR